MSDVQIATEGRKTTLISPYHPDKKDAAKRLGGKPLWDGGVFVGYEFDARDKDRVHELARELHGTDGTTAPELVTVRLELDRIGCGQTLWFAGREIAHRPGRDDPARIGDKVVVIEGGFRRSGGSVRYPELNPADGTVLEVRDLPRPAVDDEDDDGVTIVDTTGPDVEALRAERAALTTRIAEIDALLLIARIAEIDALVTPPASACDTKLIVQSRPNGDASWAEVARAATYDKLRGPVATELERLGPWAGVQERILLVGQLDPAGKEHPDRDVMVDDNGAQIRVIVISE